jgi:hypothetical protein
MAKHVNSVLVTNGVGTLGALAAGNLVIVGANNALATAPVATAKSFKAAAVLDTDGTILNDAFLSSAITRDMIEAITFEDYAAPTVSTAVITLGTPVVGGRYMVRISYNDVNEMPVQFTQSFDVISTSTSSTTLASQFVSAINSVSTVSGRSSRVTASSAAGVLTLTAKDITVDNTIETFYTFHQVQIGAASLTTKDANGNTVTAATSVVITAANKGCGYWKDVRDREKDALGYKGQMHFNDYYSPKGTMLVEKNATYSCINILYNNNYRSADNQFVKNTPLSTEIYIKGATVPSALKTAILAWANGLEVKADANDSTVL